MHLSPEVVYLNLREDKAGISSLHLKEGSIMDGIRLSNGAVGGL